MQRGSCHKMQVCGKWCWHPFCHSWEISSFKERLKEAEEVYKAGIENCPESSDLHNNYGVFLVDTGKWEGARDFPPLPYLLWFLFSSTHLKGCQKLPRQEMCLHCSLEINIPVLLRWHSVLKFVINAGTVQQWHSARLFPSVFLTIFGQAVVLFNSSWAAPWQYCSFSRKAWLHQTKSQAHKWIVRVFGALAALLGDKAALCKGWVPPL